MTAAVLAVDGGNSKTDVALVAADGTLLGHARGPGSCHQIIGIDAATRVITELVGRAADQAGLPATGLLAERGAFYLAGADLPVEVEMLHERYAGTGWSSDLVVDNDTFALLRTGSESPNRVAVVCGAGINCVGVAASGAVVRFPSLGHVSGDWGGGRQLGAEALWLAVRAEDGRGAPTLLRQAVADHFGTATVAEVSAGIHLGDIRADRLHELVPLLLDVAAAGDEAARAVVLRMADEVAVLATTALTRLDLLDEPADVVLGGGVLAARDPLLLGTAEQLVDERAPLVRITVVDAPPIVGAALLGLDALGSPAPVEDRLRVALLDRTAALTPDRSHRTVRTTALGGD
jgi:N-acetylglucosamine kinase-like BadF-type ATPase